MIRLSGLACCYRWPQSSALRSAAPVRIVPFGFFKPACGCLARLSALCEELLAEELLQADKDTALEAAPKLLMLAHDAGLAQLQTVVTSYVRGPSRWQIARGLTLHIGGDA